MAGTIHLKELNHFNIRVPPDRRNAESAVIPAQAGMTHSEKSTDNRRHVARPSRCDQ